ncbi:DUF1385 domain-containing protein [Eubacterium ruminantium]|uniref:DUF1385 domain-containing protein n=1 Tax=Eubacterium ruminantium TaxID=42322 RepID=UPI00247AD3D7|nr:DUF1385 domain-containing protein [Eubacterium ruminantium]
MKEVHIGGQAVLEGVMMKGPDSYALSVRKPDNEIAVTVTEYKSFGSKSVLFRIPIIRGVVNFIESLYIGMGTLMKSAEYDDTDVIEEEKWAKEKLKEAEELRKAGKTQKAEKIEKKVEKRKADLEKDKANEGTSSELILTLIISLGFAIAVFMLLPTFVAGLLYKVTDSSILVNLCEGVLRLAIFITYVWAISKMKEIKRTYMYHGAEHKTINCLEAGDELTPENVLKHTRFHRRCGTSFLFIVMFISIILFMFIRTKLLWLRILSRLLLIPVIAGLSYEVIRYAGSHENAFARALSQPGFWVQRLTTKEPDKDMCEVAIKSVEAVIDWREYISCVNNNSFEK